MTLTVASVLLVAAILACAGSALGGGGQDFIGEGDIFVDGFLNHQYQTCPIIGFDTVLTQDDKYNHIKYYLYRQCYEDRVKKFRNVANLESLEQVENLFKIQCGKKSNIRRCYTDLRSQSSACLDFEHHLMVDARIFLLYNAFHSVCINNGKHAAKVIREATHTTRENAFNECLKVSSIEQGLRGYVRWWNTLEFYHNLKVFKGCLINILMGNEDAIAGARLIMDGMIKNMTCVNYDHTSLVRCDSMVYSNELGLHKRCDVSLNEGERMEKKIFELGRKCLDRTGQYASQVLQYKTFQEHQDSFKTYCQKQPEIHECLADVAWKSQLCQNETRHQQFLTFRELVESTLSAACAKEGEVLANIVMFQKHNYSIASDNIPFYLCLDTYSSKMYNSFNLNITDSSRNYIFYKDVLLAKQCFDKIVTGCKKTKDRIVSHLKNVIDTFKCFHPQDDSVLLCKDLDSRKTGAIKICPIRTDDEDSPPLVNALISLANQCLPLLRKYNTGLMSNMSGVEVYNSAFRIQCMERSMARDCLSGISQLASSCLDAKHNMIVRAQVNDLTDIFQETRDILGNSVRC